MFPTGKNQRSLSAVRAKVCEILRSSVDKLLSIASIETEEMQGPKTLGGRKPIILNSFNQSLLRKIVLNFYCRGEIPNLEKIHREAQDADGFPKMGVETLRKWLHKLGYAVGKRNIKWKVYERMDVVAARHKFFSRHQKISFTRIHHLVSRRNVA